MSQDDQILAAWAAGLFDGEGCISLPSGKARVVVSIQMTDFDLLERMRDGFGGKIYSVAKRKDHWKESWKWQISTTKDSVEFLDRIYPWLGVRRKARVEEARRIARKNRAARSWEVRMKILTLGKADFTQREISEIVGCSREHVNRVLNSKR